MFVFECSSREKFFLVLFLGQLDDSEPSKLELSDEIQDSYKKHLTPDCVLLLIPEYLQTTIDSFVADPSFVTDLTRHKSSTVKIVTFNIYADFKVYKNFNDSKALHLDCVALKSDVLKYGYSSLMEGRADDVIVKSPAGTNFAKPSGNVFEEFIYTSQLARNSSENQFIAMSLLSHFPRDYDISEIYIDSSSIAVVAEAITYYIRQFKSTVCKRVKYKSFGSYEGLKKYSPDDPDCVWVIISASQSTGLGKTIKKEWALAGEQIVTILSFKPVLNEGEKNVGNQVVYNITKFSSGSKVHSSPINLQIHGENFAVEAFAPKQVSLLKRHKPTYVDKAINSLKDANCFKLNRSVSTSNSKAPIGFLDYESFREQALNADKSLLDVKHEYYLWLKQIIEWSVPRNLGFIVSHKKDSIVVSDLIQVLESCGYGNVDRKAFEDLDEESDLGDKAIIVLTSAISTGNSLVDTNRALRLAGHKGMRIFITPYTTASSKSDFESFKTSLLQGVNGFKYSFFSYRTIFVGNKKYSSWDEEKILITDLINSHGDESNGVEYWKNRKAILGKLDIGLNGLIGLNHDGIDHPLKLAPDFVFWPDNYEKDDVLNLECVYLTVASILQNLRDNEVAGDTLKTSTYQHSVLSPENFIRFNDSALQSFIWRCAIPSELDYRRSDNLSSEFQRILSKLMQSAGTEKGITCLDFLLAIAIGWIKVSKKSRDKIMVDANEYLQKPHAKLLVAYMEENLDF